MMSDNDSGNKESLKSVQSNVSARHIPDAAQRWLTPEIMALLRNIEGPHIGKKRQTVIRLAFALANQQPVAQVFNQPETCTERVWYMKWQNDSDIKRAFEACHERALEWADEETVRLEDYYRRTRRRSTAKWAAQAPDALASAMLDQAQRGADRISAANDLMRWADPDAAQQANPPAPADGNPVVSVQATANDTEELKEFIAAIREAGLDEITEPETDEVHHPQADA